jgi:FemAB-related protein (PEP-CTERM system-associated)
MRQPLFGNKLVSIPFFDMGGVIADDPETASRLITRAIRLAEDVGASEIALRHKEAFFDCTKSGEGVFHNTEGEEIYYQVQTHKTRMVMELPGSPDLLMDSFKSKLRSQIRRPIKEGLTTRTAGIELLDDFYKVFTANMRDLGSPVHSKRLMENVLAQFKGQAQFVGVYNGSDPIAASLVISFKEILANPWASSLRAFSRQSPNMLLYFRMLEYACEKGLKQFDFGRSTVHEGTYKFKEQWGAKPRQLYWYSLSKKKKPMDDGVGPVSSKRAIVEKIWRMLPLSVANFIGPKIRGHIEL